MNKCKFIVFQFSQRSFEPDTLLHHILVLKYFCNSKKKKKKAPQIICDLFSRNLEKYLHPIFAPCLHSLRTLLSSVSICIWMRLYSLSAWLLLRRQTARVAMETRTSRRPPAAIPPMASGGNWYSWGVERMSNIYLNNILIQYEIYKHKI